MPIVLIGMTFLCLLLGAVIGTGHPLLIGAVAALVCAPLALAIPSFHLAMALFVLTFLIQGSVKFFAGISAAGWLAVSLSAVLMVRTIMEAMGNRRPHGLRPPAPSLAWVSLLLYLMVFIFSLVINRPPMLQIFSASKNAFPMLAILLALRWLPWKLEDVSRLWTALVVSAFLQLPPVIYQHFVVAKHRATQGWDSVVGTMGGSMEAGGLNAMLVLFSIAALVYVAAGVKERLHSRRFGLFTLVVALAVISLGEVKAAFIWLPMAAMLLYGKDLLRRPGAAIGYGTVGLLVGVALFLAYQQMYWEGQKLGSKSLSEKIEKIGGYFFDTASVDFRTGEVSRGASIALWVADPKSDVITRLVGYGPGASKSVSSLGQGEVARRYTPLSIDATAIAVLLWDVGVVGCLFYIMVICGGVLVARRLLANRNLPAKGRQVVTASRIMLLLFLSLVIYNRTMMDEVVPQLLFLFCLGSILYFRDGYGRQFMEVASQGRALEGGQTNATGGRQVEIKTAGSRHNGAVRAIA